MLGKLMESLIPSAVNYSYCVWLPFDMSTTGVLSECSICFSSMGLIPVSTKSRYMSKLMPFLRWMRGSWVGNRCLEVFSLMMLEPWICIFMPFSMSIELVFKYIAWELFVYPLGLGHLFPFITSPLPIKEQSLLLLVIELMPVGPLLISWFASIYA